MPRDVADRRPRLVEALTPVDADHVAAGFHEIGKNRGRADAEVDERHAGRGQPVEDAPRVRQHELAIVRAPERAGPRIENLQRLRPGFDLRAQVGRHRLGEELAEPVPRGGLRVHERLGAEVVLRRSAFDRVGRQRERRAAEADERHASVELPAQEPDRLEHVPQRLAGSNVAGARRRPPT